MGHADEAGLLQQSNGWAINSVIPNTDSRRPCMNFNSILIGSEDPKRLADFYTKLFGEPAFVFEPVAA